MTPEPPTPVRVEGTRRPLANALASVWAATWRIVLFVTVWGVLYAPAVLLLAAGAAEPGAPLAAGRRVWLEIIGTLAVVLAAWGMVRFIDRRSLVSLGFSPRHIGRDLLIGLGLGSAMIGGAVAVSWLAGWARFHTADAFSWISLGVMGVAMLFNSASQEVLVRGYMLQAIEARFSAATAVIVSSVIFVGLHAGALVEGGLLPGVNLFAAGVLLGLAYTASRNLWLPIALHFAWNFLQGPVLGIAVSGQSLDSGWQLLSLEGPAVLTGGDFGLEGGLVATVVTALAILAVAALARRWDRSA